MNNKSKRSFGLVGINGREAPSVRLWRGLGVFFMALLTFSWSAILVPRGAYADDSDEEALHTCWAVSVFIGGMVGALGCTVAYRLSQSSSEDAFPTFSFSNALPTETLGKGALVFTEGTPQTLAAGLCKGFPRDCLLGPKMIQAKEDVRRVTFYVVETDSFVEATGFDDADWQSIGEGQYNSDEYVWEVTWNPTDRPTKNGYVLRADFIKADGSAQNGIGLAINSNR